VLFNTLGYAKFFGLVFVVTWLLVQRRGSLWLPWIALLACVAFDPETAKSLAPWAVCAGAFALTWVLDHFSRAARVRAAAANSDAPDESSHGGPPSSSSSATEPPTGGWSPKGPAVASWALVGSAGVNLLAVDWLLRSSGAQNLLFALLGGLGIATPVGEWTEGSVTQRVAWAVVTLACFALLRAKRIRLLFLLGASYVFYAHWDYRFLPLIFGSSSIDYWLGRMIGRAEDPTVRKRWLVATVVLNLGVLGCFKYLGFGVQSATLALQSLGFDVPLRTLQIALPVGISFFTFESMSYVIDVYRRDLPPHDSYLEYLSFVAFFPHLVAGPIVRPRDLLPQLGGAPRFSAAEGSEGLYLIAWGLLKKVAISDTLALNLVDRVFDAPTSYSSLECYAAVVAYAVQIYCDFSGYTDIAIGSALLLGVRFPLNFNVPYQAVDIQDFWRRWHISLSTWLRDYLYIPLGGNRKGPVRTYVNLMLTMLLGGLWHGANWTFVAWGGLHGAALAAQRAWGRKTPPRPGTPRHVLGVFVTFHFVCLAWVFFRSESFGKAWTMLTQVAELTTHHANLHWRVLAVLAIGLLTHWMPKRWYLECRRRFIELPAIGQGVVLCVVALVLREMTSAEAVPFVYFQF